MTTHALVRHSSWDPEHARDSLRSRVLDASAGDVQVVGEPLFRHGENGLLQAVRVVAPGVSTVEVRTASGAALPTQIEPAPGGVRVLIPEVSTATSLTLTVPGRGDVEVEVRPQRHWTVHLVHHTHLDIGYTDPQGVVLAQHLSYLDSCLDLVEATDGWPDDAQFRWCVEALWSFDQWRNARPRARVGEFMRRVREGRIELTAMPFNLHTETCSTDELHELLRLAKDVRDEHGVEFTSAMQTDVPGAVVGLVDALAQAGVRYLSVAHNWAGRSVPHLVGGEDLPRLFRWRAPSGAELLVWVTDTPHGMAYMEGPLLGFDTSYDMVDELLPAYLRSLADNPYPYAGDVFGWASPKDNPLRSPYPWDVLHLRVQGKFGDNAPPRRTVAEIVRRWNETWAFPRLRVSRNEDFFADAEARYGDSIATFTGDWNDWWADGVGSGARPLQMAREAQGLLADAQTIGSIAALRGGDGAVEDVESARPAYLAVSLFDEHTWGASDPWTDGEHGGHSGEQQWHWKYGQALRGHELAATLLDSATARLAGVGRTTDGVLASFDVVNTCGWARTDVVSAFLPESRVPLDVDVSVVDSRNGKRLPFDEVPQTNPNHRDAGRFLVASVDDVPAVGWMRLDIVEGDGGSARPPAEDTVLENEFLRVRIDLATATIASIVDKATGREIVNPDATVGFNGYVYDRYGSGPEMNHTSGKVEETDRLGLMGPRAVSRPAALVSRRSTATAEEIEYESVAEGARWLRTTVTLRHGVARLDIANRIGKDATRSKESAYFAFPFALAQPRVRFEASGGVVGTDIPTVPGGAAHMRAMRRWASLDDGRQAVAWSTMDAPLVQLGQIAVPYAPFPPTLPVDEPATLFSWVHNNLWDTNFPGEQRFEMSFRYSIATAAVADADTGPVLAVRTAAAGARPLTAVLATTDGELSEEPPAEASLLTLDDDRVRVVGLITPRTGQLVVRLQSVAAEPVTVALRTPLPLVAAWAASYLGDVTGELPISGDTVTATIPPYTAQAVLLAVGG